MRPPTATHADDFLILHSNFSGLQYYYFLDEPFI